MRSVVAVAAALLILACPAASARADDAAVLYDPGTVTTVDLTMTPGALDALRAEPKEWAAAGATFTLPDGRTSGPWQIGVKTKGNASWKPIDQKAGLKLKFAHLVKKQKVLGLKGMTLNNLAQDKSYQHETLSYAMMRAGGVEAARTGYAYVRLNGVGKGLYLNLEPYDEVFLQREFASTQHLYEGESTADFSADRRGQFEVDEGDEDATTDLDAAIAAIGGWPANDSPLFDRAQLLRTFAGESFVGHWDGYSNNPAPPASDPTGSGWWKTNNFYVHSDAAGRFSLLPSGMDQTLSNTAPRNGFGQGQGLLFTRCMADDTCRGQFRTALRTFSDATLNVGMYELAARAQATVTSWRRCADQSRPTEEEWHKATDYAYFFVSERRENAAKYLGDPPPTRDYYMPRDKLPADIRGACPAPAVQTPPAPEQPVPTPEPDPDPGAQPDPAAPAPGGPVPPPADGGATVPASPVPPASGGVAGVSDSRRCVVPKLRGRTITRARKLLRASGCRPGLVVRRGDGRRVARGAWRVRTSKPGAGARRPGGTKVVMLVTPKR